MRTLHAVLRTCKERWTIGTDGERETERERERERERENLCTTWWWWRWWWRLYLHKDILLLKQTRFNYSNYCLFGIFMFYFHCVLGFCFVFCSFLVVFCFIFVFVFFFFFFTFLLSEPCFLWIRYPQQFVEVFKNFVFLSVDQFTYLGFYWYLLRECKIQDHSIFPPSLGYSIIFTLNIRLFHNIYPQY